MQHLRRWLEQGPGKEVLRELIDARVREELAGGELAAVIASWPAGQDRPPMIDVYATRGVKAIVRVLVCEETVEDEERMVNSMPLAFRQRLFPRCGITGRAKAGALLVPETAESRDDWDAQKMMLALIQEWFADEEKSADGKEECNF